MKQKKTFIAFFLALIMAPSLTLAADFRAASEQNQTVETTKTEIFSNLYLAGYTLDSKALVKGDLIAAGNTINSDSSVGQSLFAAGQTVNVDGNVAQNARVAGAEININGIVSQDLFAAGQNVHLGSSAVINGDVYIAADRITIDGQIKGGLKAYAGTILINGKIGSNVVIKGVNKLELGDKADLGGKLDYSSPTELKKADSAKIAGAVNFDQTKNIKKNMVPAASAAISSFLISFIALLLLIMIFPKWSKSIVEAAFARPSASIGWGLFALVVIPLASILIMITILGIKVGLIVLSLYGVFLAIASLFSALFIGSYLMKIFNKSDKKAAFTADWKTALVGSIALLILSSIPLIGWFIVFVVFLMGLGILFIQLWEFIKLQKA